MDIVQPLPIAVRRLWRAIAVVEGIAAFLVLITVETLLARQVDLPWPPVVIPLAAGALIVGIGWPMATLRYRFWRFQLTDHWIQARWGVLNRHSATIPRNRIQTLTSENGPIDRFLGLTSVTVHTAGSGAPNLSIPHLEDPTVEWLREELARGAVD